MSKQSITLKVNRKTCFYLVYALLMLLSLIFMPKIGVSMLLVEYIIVFIKEMGYIGIFITMTLESALVPIPSEIVVPFSGFLATQGYFDFWHIVFISSIANLTGSIIAYFIGLKFGRSFVIKYGKYLLIKEEIIIKTEELFRRWGDVLIFFSRIMPAVRTVISLPAGFSKMDLKKFVLFTFFGSLPWNFMLTYAGYILAHNWVFVANILESYELFFILLVLFVFIKHYIFS
ncbi:MAG: DedA family protein [Candidatus Baldrarchaeia archaeon]